jgi:hypothetical protein
MLLMRRHRFNGALGVLMMIHVRVLGSGLSDAWFISMNPDRAKHKRQLTP